MQTQHFHLQFYAAKQYISIHLDEYLTQPWPCAKNS